MRPFYLFILSLAVLAASCGDDETTNSRPTTASVLIPLRTGTFWRYVDTLFNQVSSTLAYVEIDSVLAQQEADGQLWYAEQLQRVYADHTDRDTLYVNNREDGMWRREEVSFWTPPYLYYKYPAHIGDTFGWLISQRTVVTGTSVPVTTPAGRFKCYQYVQVYVDTSLHRSDSTWIAPGIGIIQSMAVDSTGVTFVRRLTAY